MSKPSSDCIVRSAEIAELLESDLELVVRKLGGHLQALSEDMQFCLERPEYARSAGAIADSLLGFAKKTRREIRHETKTPAFDLDYAKKLAGENYETWGQWVIECMSDSELLEDTLDYDTIKDWVDMRKGVGSVFKEIEDTAW